MEKQGAFWGAAGRSLKVSWQQASLGSSSRELPSQRPVRDAYRIWRRERKTMPMSTIWRIFYGRRRTKQLSGQAQTLSEKMKMEAVIVTTEENSDSAQVFADGFYTEGGFGTGSEPFGNLFLIDMDNRELYIRPTEIRYMTDSRIEDVLDDVYGYASDADYYRAASAFLCRYGNVLCERDLERSVQL